MSAILAAAGATVLVTDALGLLVAATAAAAKLAPMIQAAQAAGQTTLSAADWASIVGDDDAALSQLSAAIAAARIVGK